MEMENKIPEWEAQGTEPPASLKASGFEAGYKPPADYFNWFWHGVCACLKEIFEKLSGHAADTNNPHKVTKAQLGLDKVDNTADSAKNVAFASEAAAARKVQHDMVVHFDGGRTEGTNMWTYNGSTSRSINITPDNIGAAKTDMSNVDTDAFRELMEAVGSGIPIVSATSIDGVAYTANVNGITELYNGLLVTIIPEITSTSTAVTLDINGLGAKMVRLPLSFNNAAMSAPRLETYYSEGRPITLQYDANYGTDGAWKTFGKQRTSAQDLYGTVPIESGGTGAETAEAARANLGAASKFHATAAIGTTWEGSGPYTQTVAVEGLLESDTPIIDLVASADLTTAEAELAAWAAIYRIDTADGSITVYASEATTQAITIQMLGVR